MSSCSGTYTIQTDTNADDRKHCTVIGGTLSIQGGAGLTASGLDKLSGLERVCGAVSIQNLPLTDLAWLNALEFVGGDLTIENNANDLDTLEALDNLLYIGEAYSGKIGSSTRRRQHHAFSNTIIVNPGRSAVAYDVGGASGSTTAASYNVNDGRRA